MGNVLSAGVGQAPARQAALGAGLPPTVSALTVNMVCGSGLRSVMLADQAIRAGDARVIVAGGMENMSLSPYLLQRAREGWKFGDQKVFDSMIHDGLWCAFEQTSMGAAADYIADRSGISREAQDRFARRKPSSCSSGNCGRCLSRGNRAVQRAGPQRGHAGRA